MIKTDSLLSALEEINQDADPAHANAWRNPDPGVEAHIQGLILHLAGMAGFVAPYVPMGSIFADTLSRATHLVRYESQTPDVGRFNRSTLLDCLSEILIFHWGGVHRGAKKRRRHPAS